MVQMIKLLPHVNSQLYSSPHIPFARFHSSLGSNSLQLLYAQEFCLLNTGCCQSPAAHSHRVEALVVTIGVPPTIPNPYADKLHIRALWLQKEVAQVTVLVIMDLEVDPLPTRTTRLDISPWIQTRKTQKVLSVRIVQVGRLEVVTTMVRSLECFGTQLVVRCAQGAMMLIVTTKKVLLLHRTFLRRQRH